MGLYFYVLVFVIGLAIGSFFNVVIFRFGGNKSIVIGRSKCLSCKSTIRWFDFIPLISYLILSGRCRNCNVKISLLYPMVEFSSATALLLLFLNSSWSYLSVLSAVIVLLFVLITFIDMRYLIIPDKTLIALAAAVATFKIAGGDLNFSNLLISSFGLTAFFAILFVISGGKWIGLGDIKLILIISLLFGYPFNYLALVFSIWTAGIFSFILLIVKKATLKTQIPFGSFLSIAAIIFIIFSHGLQEISKHFY